MAEVGLLPFARVALQVSRAVLPRHRSRFSKHQFNQPQLLKAPGVPAVSLLPVPENVNIANHKEGQ